MELTRTDGELVCRARVATSFASRFRGLMGTARLPRGSGLLFPGSRSVHTHFMRFPIDVVFLDRELRVLRVADAVKPWRAAACRGARAVLELAAGEASARGIAVGERLSLRDDP